MKIKISNFIKAHVLTITVDQAKDLSKGTSPESVLSNTQLEEVKKKFRNLNWKDLVIWNAEKKNEFPSVVWIYREPVHFRYRMSN